MKVFILILSLCPLFITEASAEEIYTRAADEMGIYQVQQALEGDARQISGELSVNGSYDAGSALSRLAEKAIALLKQELKKIWGSSARLMSLTVISAAAAALCPDKTVHGSISLAACCAAALMLTSGLDGIVSLASDSITLISDYSRAAIPAVFTAAAATGAVVTASARYAAVCVAIELIMSVAQSLIIPLVNAYLALVMADSLMDNTILKTFARAVKWCANTLMTAATSLFGSYIAMTGLITASTDAFAVKTTKTVISASLPVVGGIISDASGIVLSAASVIKNSAGIFSLIAVCALCIGPFVTISVKMLFFKAASALAGMMPDKRLAALFSDVGTAMSLLLGLLGCCGIMMFISFMAAIKVVSPA